MEIIKKKNIGIIGGGPAGLFMYKRLVESRQSDLRILIFEKKEQAGAGMPYSYEGACNEHITNVSGNEIPQIVTPVKEWIQKAPQELLKKFDIDPDEFNDFKVMPRLLFGEYLNAQFSMLVALAKQYGISTEVYVNTLVTDIKDDEPNNKVRIFTEAGKVYDVDAAIICTGHRWPKLHEGQIPGWFDSPYPPSKLTGKFNFPVAIKGASLTAIDAVRTLARQHGFFTKEEDHTLTYTLNTGNPEFRLVLHSISGLLPAIRFHLEDSHLSAGTEPLKEEEMREVMSANEGFVPLDYIFERNFKKPLKEAKTEFYEKIKDMTLEDFVDYVMSLRNRVDAFQLFKGEYIEAEKSIKRHQSVYWKEMLAVLSYAMNYPAKHLPAEDMLRLKKVLMPLISIVIAFVPQSSCRELLALHDAGVLSLVPVGRDSKVEPGEENGAWYSYTDENGLPQRIHYNLFVDAVGQVPFMFKDFIFESLKDDGTVSSATLRFRDKNEAEKETAEGNGLVFRSEPDQYYLKVPGININDHFQVLDQYGVYNDRVYVMAVPYIAGLNPDYSGLDFCEAASLRIIKSMLQEEMH